MTESIRVAVRVRPILPNESTSTCISVSGNQLRVGEERYFAFDNVFDQQATSDDVYVCIGQPLADTFLSGYNASTIAYGQTGAGKTFTMSTLSSDVIQEVFCRICEDANGEAPPPLMTVSALEIYNETLVDLFGSPLSKAGPSTASPSSLNDSASSSPAASSSPPSTALLLREDPKGGVYVSNLTERSVATEEELLNLVDYATSKRKTASTLMNAYSSRSHCIVTLVLSRKGITSKCSFVDLAGSERFKKSLGLGGGAGASNGHGGGSTGSPSELNSAAGTAGINVAGRLREGISINSGLLALGNVIVALCERRPHVPYRASKLTRVLQPMLGGNSRTAMVACVSPISASFEESLNTLKYADRVKSIKTRPQFVVAAIFSPDEAARTVAALHQDIEVLKAQLSAALAAAAPPPSSTALTVAGGSASASTGSRPAPTSMEAMLRGELDAVRAELATERNLTRRLKEDLFNAEYTTMVEVEKRKVLEERLEAAAAPAHAPPHHDALAGTRQGRKAEVDQPRAVSESRQGRGRSSSLMSPPVGEDALDASGAERGRLTIAHLERQNEETAKRISGYARGKEEAVEERDTITEELRLAEIRLEQSEAARQQKEVELQRLREEYRARLQGAEQKAADYARRAAQAEREMSTRQNDIERMKTLQAKVDDLRDEVQRQRTNARQQQRKASEVSVTHSSEIQQLQRQLRDAEEQRGKLETQLQRREEEIVRVRSKVPGYAAATRSSSAASGATRAAAVARVNGATPPVVPSSVASAAPTRGRAAVPPTIHAHPRRNSQLAPSTQPTEEPNDIQAEINTSVARLEHLERELAELLAYRETIEETRSEALRWEKPIEQLGQQAALLEQQMAADPTNIGLLAQYSATQERLTELQPFLRIVAESNQQCEEFTTRIESLMEARRFHTRQVRRLQRQRDTSAAEDSQTIDLAHRHNASSSSITSLPAASDFSTAPPSVREIAKARVIKPNPRR